MRWKRSRYERRTRGRSLQQAWNIRLDDIKFVNYASGISNVRLTHEDVIINAKQNKEKLLNFLLKFN